MPLGVIRHVDEQSAHGSWQSLLAHGSWLFQIGLRQRSHPRRSIRQGRGQLFKQLRVGCPRVEFRPQTRHLLLAQISPLGICQQPIYASRQVPDVKRNRRRTRRANIHFSIRKIAAPLPQIFVRQLQGVQNCASHRWHVYLRATQPWLG
jgi:hypothetical protein